MHGQRSSATRVDDPGEVRTPPPRPLRGHPSSSEEGKPHYSARRPTTLLAPPPPCPLRGHPSSREEGKPHYSARRPTTLLAPPPPRPLRGHPSSREDGKSLEPQHQDSPS